MTDAVEKVPNCPALFFRFKKNLTDDRRIDVGSITLPRSPASLSSGNEVSHIFYTKVACTAKRNFDHECKKTFSTASVHFCHSPINFAVMHNAVVKCSFFNLGSEV